MKKTLKRWGALLLAVIMALSLLPTAALAADGNAASDTAGLPAGENAALDAAGLAADENTASDTDGLTADENAASDSDSLAEDGNAASSAVSADDSSRDIPTERYTMSAGSALDDNTQHNEGPADYAKDGNESTWWHTANFNSVSAENRYIAVELDEASWISALRYKPRGDYTSSNPNASPTVNGNGYVTDYEVYVSQNGTEWTKVADGHWDVFDSNSIPNGNWQAANFTPVQAKYIKLLGVHTAGNGQIDQYMHAAEIRVVSAPEQQSYSVSGTVVDASGALLSGAAVTIGGQRATTGADGAYTINDLADGDYTAAVVLDGYELETGAQVTVNGGDVTGHTLQMRAVSRAVTGTVTSGGSDLADATVTLVQNNAAYTAVSGPTTTTGSDGSYTLNVNGVAAGSYRVRVSKAGYDAAIGSPVEIVTSSPTGTFSAGEVSINAIDTAQVSYNFDMSDESRTPQYTAASSSVAVRVENQGLFMNFSGSSRQNNQVRLNGVSLQDAVVEFDAVRGGTSASGGFGVMLRWADNNNCFFVGQNSTGGWYSESVSAGTSGQSAAAAGPSFNTGETRHFKFRLHQDGGVPKVSLWIDGVTVIDDAQAGNGQGPEAPGQLAFTCGANNTTVTVKNLYITREDTSYTITMPDTLAGYVLISGTQDMPLTAGTGSSDSDASRYTAHAGDVVNIYSADLTQKEMSAPLTVHKTQDNSISSTENILHVPTSASTHKERGSYIQFVMPAYDVTLEPTLTPVEADEKEAASVLILRSGDPDIPQTISTGGSAALNAIIIPGVTTELEWSSNNEEVATVEGATRSNPDETGRTATAAAVVTGHSAGTATITITTANGKTDTREVIVGTAVTNVIFSNTSEVILCTNGMDAQKTATLTATIVPADAANKALKWVSSDETVATVNQDGTVTAVAPGTARITAISQENTAARAYRDVKVVTLPERLTLSLDHADLTTNVGDAAYSVRVVPTLSPRDATDQTITWTTGNSAVATVTKPWAAETGIQDALVTAQGVGTTTITAASAADGSITATMTVTVKTRIVGKAAVSGETKFGSELTVDINDIIEGAKADLTYQWYRGAEAAAANAIADANEKTYTPVKEDIGCVLTVKVTAGGNYVGETTFTTAEITKADGPAMQATPTHRNVTVEGATDGAITGLFKGRRYEYQKLERGTDQPDESKWIAFCDESGTETPSVGQVHGTAEITGLGVGNYVVRRAGDDTHFAGPVSNTVTIAVQGASLYELANPHNFEGGVVQAGRTQIPAGDTVRLRVTPNEGWRLSSLTVTLADNSTITPTESSSEAGVYTFTMPASNVTVSAVFEKLTYTIVHDLSHISCNMAEHNHTAVHGEAFSITLTPDEGYDMPRALTVTVTGTTDQFTDYTYTADPADPAKRVLTFAHGVTRSVTVSGAATLKSFPVEYVRERASFVIAPARAEWHKAFSAAVIPDAGYRLPDSIDVTMGGQNVAFTYNKETGGIYIAEGIVEDSLSITVRAGKIVAPLEKVSISGTAQVGQRLTANITPAEADGHVSYQWYWVDSEGAETLVEGATGRTRVVTEASLGKSIVVKATALDGHDFSGVVESQPTGVVISADAPEVLPQWVQIRRDSVNIEVDGTDTLIAYVGPDSATNKTVSWSSSNPDVVTVENGVITGVSPGTAVITVTAEAGDNITDTCTVTVTVPQAIRAGAEDVLTPYDGQAHSISVTVTNPVQNAVVTYSSDGLNFHSSNPTFSAVGEHTVWYKVEAPELEPFYGYAKVVIEKAAPQIVLSADRTALSSAGSVILTVSHPDYVDASGLYIVPDDLMIPIVKNEDGTYTAELPGTEKTYTFTAMLTGTDNYDSASATCTVTVASPTPDIPVVPNQPSTPSTTTKVEKNEDGSTTTTVTDKKTGAVTVTTENADGGKVVKATDPEKNVVITVTDKDGEVLAKVELPAILPEPEKKFVDVPEGHWSEKAINDMAALGVVNGVGGNRFDRQGNMKRGDLALILSRMSNAGEGYELTFTDVPASKYYANGVAWAAKTGVVTGRSEDAFKPEDTITREELALMLYRYAKLLRLDAEAPATALDAFTDGGSTNSWAREGVAWCVKNGILQGKGGGVLDPRTNVTRAEVAVMLQRFIGLMK